MGEPATLDSWFFPRKPHCADIKILFCYLKFAESGSKYSIQTRTTHKTWQVFTKTSKILIFKCRIWQSAANKKVSFIWYVPTLERFRHTYNLTQQFKSLISGLPQKES